MKVNQFLVKYKVQILLPNTKLLARAKGTDFGWNRLVPFLGKRVSSIFKEGTKFNSSKGIFIVTNRGVIRVD